MKDYPETWATISFEDGIETISDFGLRIEQRDYLSEGLLPVIDQGINFIGGYTNDLSKKYQGPLPIIVFGDHTRRIKYVDFDFAVGAQGVKLLRPRDCWIPKYLAYLLSVSPIPDRGYGRHYQLLRKLVFVLPPLKDQVRILSELEKELSLIEAGQKSLHKTLSNLNRYHSSVLIAACEGRLVPRETQLVCPAERASNTPTHSRAPNPTLKRQGKRKEKDAIEIVDLPTLPKGWRWISANLLAKERSNSICAGPFGTIFKARDFRPNGVPIIFLRHVKPGSYSTARPTYMDQQKWTELFQPYSVIGGELLITKLGDPPGDCAIYPPGQGPAMLTPDVIKMEVNEQLASPIYLMHYFNSGLAKRLTSGLAFGTTRLRLTLPLFKDLPVPLPPRLEQDAIVDEVDRRLSLASAVKSVVLSSQAHAEHLRRRVLQYAFEGRLFP